MGEFGVSTIPAPAVVLFPVLMMVASKGPGVGVGVDLTPIKMLLPTPTPDPIRAANFARFDKETALALAVQAGGFATPFIITTPTTDLRSKSNVGRWFDRRQPAETQVRPPDCEFRRELAQHGANRRTFYADGRLHATLPPRGRSGQPGLVIRFRRWGEADR